MDDKGCVIHFQRDFVNLDNTFVDKSTISGVLLILEVK